MSQKGLRVNEITLYTGEFTPEDELQNFLNNLLGRGFQIKETNPFSEKYDPSQYQGVEEAFLSGEKFIYLDRIDGGDKTFNQYLCINVNSNFADEVTEELSGLYPSGVNEEGWNEENWIFQSIVRSGQNTYPIKDSISPKGGLKVNYKIDPYTRNNESTPQEIFSIFDIKIFTGVPVI